MNLTEYLKKHGTAASAQRFGVSTHTIKSWRWGNKYPRTDKANEIVAITGGEVSLAGIYVKQIKK